MKTEEAALKVKCRLYLARLGAYRFSPVQMGYGSATLDDLCCVKGRFVGIEYKAKGKKPTPRQEQCMKFISLSGGVAFWCDDYESFLLNMAANGLAPYA
jgi:hypothetical protein